MASVSVSLFWRNGSWHLMAWRRNGLNGHQINGGGENISINENMKYNGYRK
jgi:hypothetical protein